VSEDFFKIAVLSDIHYASDAEKMRGEYELRTAKNRFQKTFLKLFRHFVWKKDPFAHNHDLENFIKRCNEVDLVVALGDYSCDSGFIGVVDDATFTSAKECLEQLRSKFGNKFLGVIGDHELGKMSLVGGKGGLRISSYYRAVQELKLEPVWILRKFDFVFIGVASTLAALKVYEAEVLDTEKQAWSEAREAFLEKLNYVFSSLTENDRIILFCHDPTAIPWLASEPELAKRLSQIELTLIGHLHSELVFLTSKILAGIPTIRFLGNSIRRMTHALNEARVWKKFNTYLCPALSGIELLKNPAYLELILYHDRRRGIKINRCSLAT
jgi:predicted MPP superfamily phosphohydrolase